MTIEELQNIFKDIDSNKKKVVESMFDDFIHEAKQLEEYKNMMVEYKTPKTRAEADKLKFYTKMYGDISQRHDSKIKIFLSALSKFEGAEENPISVWLKERNKL